MRGRLKSAGKQEKLRVEITAKKRRTCIDRMGFQTPGIFAGLA
jgi:hypothetical protein